jgi:hypothetical protein
MHLTFLDVYHSEGNPLVWAVDEKLFDTVKAFKLHRWEADSL